MQGPGPQTGRSNYLDFELEIGLGTGREYPVTLLRSPAGEAHATMYFPFDELALDLRLGRLQIALLRSGGKHRRAPSEEEQAVQDLGRSLFEALFRGRVRTCYDVSLRQAAEQEMGLRLKLRIRPPELSALPWELLYDPNQAEYVCLSRQTPIVRYLESPRLIRPLTVSPPLRILGVVASPEKLPALDIEREVQRVERATQGLRDRGLLELEWLPGQTWRDLQEAMWGGPWHVFHFIGHGGFDAQADEGFIALADRDGRRSDLSATRLSRLLADHAHLRLVLLNACEGAKGGERDIYSSTASILVHRGIPAVLAMQYAITDRAAIEFARAFYRALAFGMAVDEAVVAARKAIDLAVTNTVEWGTPVLYMRTPDGVLFDLTETPPVEAPAPAAEVDTELEWRLEQRYTAGLSAFWLGDWDEACGHFQAIVEERPDYQDAADKLAEARHQKKWSELYEQAQAAREAEDWEAARLALEALVAEKPDYKDAAALLEAMNRQVRLAGLYAQAQRLHQAGQWQAVVNVFAQIAALDPDYADPEGLLPAAKQELAEQTSRAALDELYSRAVREMDAGRWAEAQRLLQQVQKQETGYLETERLLARAESEIEGERQQQAEDRRQEQIASLYAEAQKLADAGQWQPALDKMGQIRDLDPQFADPEGIDARARTGLEREEREAQRQRELAVLYTEAVGLLRAKRFEEALDQWAEVQALDPAYPDREKVQAAARKKLAAQDRPVLWRRLPRGAWVALGAVALVAVLVAGGAALWQIITATPGPSVPGPVPENPSAGTVWEWSDGSTMVYVPAGAFWMGSDESDPDAEYDEKPQHEVTLDAFWIDRTEVTNAQYRRCVDDGACSPPSSSASDTRDSYYGASEFDDYPVIYVNWEQANTYCAWAGKRLPTVAEWEKAARGTDKRIYPWGNAFDGSLVNFCDVNCESERNNQDRDDGAADTAPVGSYPGGASPYKALDMAGNVWEWVADWYGEDYYASSPDRNPQGPDSGERRGQRGGSWSNYRRDVRAAYRGYAPPSNSFDDAGFRCARSDSESPKPVGTATPARTPPPTSALTPTPGPPAPGPVPENPNTGAVWEWSDGSAMVYVPAGAFWMGTSDEDIDAILAECSNCQRHWYASEQPQHEVTLDAFWVDRTEVTNAQYRRCVDEGACSPPSSSASESRDSYYDASEFDNYPVIYVDWAQANSYCTWVGKRLPTEAEWEKAARGTDKRLYPWGNAFDGSLVNFCDVNCTFDSKAERWDDSYVDTSPVGYYPGNASPYSALDMAGNVWEWVADWYSEDYYAHSPAHNPQGPDSGQWRVKRGGAWGDDLRGVRSAIRHSFDPTDSDSSIGFRCTRSDSEPPQGVSTATPTLASPPPTFTPTATPRPPTNTPPPTSTPQAGATRVWEKDDSVMVYVPAGAFWMGSEESDPDANDDEKPQHEVTLDAFWIDRTEVTNAMFTRFVADSNYETDAEKRGSSRAFNASSGEWEDTDGADWQHPYGPFTSLDGLDKHPVVHVSWNDAAAYCQWAGKRLPTEAEWAKAARSTDKRIYPWGNAFDGSLVSFCDANCELAWKSEDWDDGYADTAPVGNYPGGESPYGAWDMAGNVWEWTGSLYQPYPYDGEDGREDQEAGGARVLRGGSWLNLGVRAAPRNVDEPSLSHSNVGFRCARSDSESPRPVGTATPTRTAPTSTPTLAPGPPAPGQVPENPSTGTIWEWSDGSAMVHVPAGPFWMGSDESDPYDRDDEKPQHEVHVDAFWMDRTEVTNGQYRRCVEDGACSPPSQTRSYSRDSYYGTSEFDEYPVMYVDWARASAYCAWAGKRLPTEAEWEKAARGTDKRIYPWGSDFDGTLLNFCDVNCGYDHGAEDRDDGYADTAPVGNYLQGASHYGALDMAGNVSEWVADWYGEDYYASSPDRNPQGPGSGAWRVLRGGSWAEYPGWVRAAMRMFGEPSISNLDLGFRCARSDSEP